MNVYVLRPGSRLVSTIIPKSGIVGREVLEGANSGCLIVDYEGRKYNQANIVTWADRVFHAAGRASADYPTAARFWLDPDERGGRGPTRRHDRMGVAMSLLERKFNVGDYVTYPQDDDEAEGRIEGIGFGPGKPVYYVMPNEHPGEILTIPEDKLEAL